jgi:serine/threonine protein kinase
MSEENSIRDGNDDVNSRNGNIFWIDSSCEVAVASLISLKGYCGIVLQAGHGTLYLEESMPSNATLLPRYICRMIPKYNERECRALCQQVVKLLQVLHGANTAHRNLNMTNVVVDEDVR